MALSRRYRFHLVRTIQIALPIVFGQLGHIFTGLADSVMVGQLGTDPLAAVALGHSIFVIFLVFGMGLSMGLTPHVATADGSRDIDSNIQWLRNGLYVNGSTGLLMSLAMLVGLPLVYYLNQPLAVVEAGWSYMQILALSIFPLMIYQHYKQFAEGLSYTKVAMYISILANLFNIGLNYLLIFGIWIFPRMELFGAGSGHLPRPLPDGGPNGLVRLQRRSIQVLPQRVSFCDHFLETHHGDSPGWGAHWFSIHL